MLNTTLLINLTLIFFPSNSNNTTWFFRLWGLALGAFLSMFNMFFNFSSVNITSYFFSLTPTSAALITLTWWISFLIIVASHNTIFLTNKSPNTFSLIVVLLNFILLLTFSATSILWFYIFFEISLLPTLLLILGWGYQPERLQAGIYMMLYTVTASLPFLAILFLNNISLNNHILLINKIILLPWTYTLVMLFSLLAFIVKLPVYSIHLWLPKAHVEAPVAGSIILAGILLNLGGFGLIQTIIFYSFTSNFLFSLLTSIAIWGGIITSIICLRQTDLKSLIAYSSVAHISFVLASVFSLSSWGWSAALIIIISHGLVSSSMFCLSNIAYESVQSRSVLIPNGLLTTTPAFTIWWFLFCTANIPTPPTISLISEIIAIPAIIHFSSSLTLIIAIMGILSAAYNLFVFTSTQHGILNNTINPYSLPNNIYQKLFFLHFVPLVLLTLTLPNIIV